MKRVKICLVLLLLALMSGGAWCAELRCSVCHKTIKLYYPLADNKVICMDCYKERKISVQRQLICSVCRRVISGSYYEPKKKQLICESCYEKQRPVCVCCRQKIRGTTYSYSDGVKACEKCVKDNSKPHCNVCSCPLDKSLTPPIPVYGGYVCDTHRHEIVASKTIALGIMQQVRRNMVSVLGTKMIIRQPVELKLVNKQDLYKAYRASTGIKLAGFCHTEGRGAAMKHTIYILGGRSRADTFTTMAHELAHAWHDENNSEIDKLDGLGTGSDRFVEGFAEWVAYKTTEVFGDKRKLQRLLNKDNDAYRLGLRDFLQYEKQHGKDAALEAARTRTSL